MRVAAVLGPTAAGKSALALELARRWRAAGQAVEIVAVDAFTIYRGMDIGTATPSTEERADVPHHLVDTLPPTAELTVADFRVRARAAIDAILDRGALPLLVGGSGLYWRAVVDDLTFPPTDPALRAAIARRFAGRAAEAHRELRRRDPPAAARIDPANLRRTVRALEVIELTGTRFSAYDDGWDAYRSIYDPLTVAYLEPPGPVLRARIERRAAAMVEAGLLAEAQHLRESGGLSRTARQAIGYAEAFAVLDGRLAASELASAVATRTWRYAKRQRGWFRRDPRCVPVEPEDVVASWCGELPTGAPAPPAPRQRRTVPGMEFTLAHGTRNDFVVVTDLDDRLQVDDGLVRALCDRQAGVGADGLIRVGGPGDGFDVFMDYRNADGSIVEMCGNGVRVVAKHVVDRGLVVPDAQGQVRIGTRSGVRPVRIVGRHADGRVAQVAVDMGHPVRDPAEVPFLTEQSSDPTHRLEVGGAAAAALGTDHLVVAVASMGNPHAVTLVDDVDLAPVEVVGPAVETHPRFPARVNLGFAQVVDRTRIRLRVWERGVGETAACGTGACAAVAVLQAGGHVGDAVEVRLPGGTLRVARGDDGRLTMTGPAVEIATGRLDDAWLDAVVHVSDATVAS